MKPILMTMKICALSVLLSLAWQGSLSAQYFAEDEQENDDAASFEESLGRFYEAQDRRRVKTLYEKTHRNTLSEFQPVVQPARQSTVKVFRGDYVKALGTVVAQEGLIITKASEIEDDGELAVELPGGERKTAELVEVNEANDLALLWVHEFNLTPVRWAPGRETPVGSLVATPGSLTLPIAIGSISLPLRNLSESNKGFLGVSMKAAENGTGLTVLGVLADSGAEAAGIEPGDLIQAIDGQPMKTEYDLQNTISSAEPGDVVAVQLLRRDESLILEVILGDSESGRGFATPQHEMLDNTARMGGRVSRKRSGYLAALQHDMLLKPNQCGGPLVNLDGDAIGVNIARASRVKSYAIPSEVIQEWIGDPRERAKGVLLARVQEAEAARAAAEAALREAEEAKESMKADLEALEAHRAALEEAALPETESESVEPERDPVEPEQDPVETEPLDAHDPGQNP